MKTNIIFLIILSLLLIRSIKSQELTYTRMNLINELNDPKRTQNSAPVFLNLDTEPKSVGRAFLFSLLLPGSGEFYNGNKNHGRFFLGTELVLWAGLFANREYVDILKEEYYSYAAQHARIDRQGKDKTFWVNIGKYDNLFEFNEQRRRDRFVSAIYPEDENYSWDWDSKQNRFTYDSKRITANEVSNRDTYFYAAIVMNHIVSGINAMRLARKYNKKLMAAKRQWDFRFYSHRESDHGHRFGFRFITTF